jgi:hypothetical protein
MAKSPGRRRDRTSNAARLALIFGAFLVLLAGEWISTGSGRPPESYPLPRLFVPLVSLLVLFALLKRCGLVSEPPKPAAARPLHPGLVEPCPRCSEQTAERAGASGFITLYYRCIRCGFRFKKSLLRPGWRGASGPEDDARFTRLRRPGVWENPPRPTDLKTEATGAVGGLLWAKRQLRRARPPAGPVPPVRGLGFAGKHPSVSAPPPLPSPDRTAARFGDLLRNKRRRGLSTGSEALDKPPPVWDPWLDP